MSSHSAPYYSDKYTDDKFEYRHVHVPREWVKSMPKDRTMTEQEWRDLGELIFNHSKSLNDHSRRPTITGMGTLHDSRAGTTCTPISTCNCEIIFYTNLSDTTPSRTRKNTPPPPLENTRTPYQRHHSPPPKNAVIYVNNVIESALLSLPLLYYMIRRRISPIWICRHTMYHPCLLIILNAIS